MEVNHDVIAGKLMQVRGRLKELRARLKHDHMQRLTGEVEVQVGRLRERFGVANARARRSLKQLGKQHH